MSRLSRTVAESRNYSVQDVKAARQVALIWLQDGNLDGAVDFGLPEIDDRYHIWRVPLIQKGNKERLGEVVIDAMSSLIQTNRTTRWDVLEARLLGRRKKQTVRDTTDLKGNRSLSPLRSVVALGDSEEILQELPAECVDLVFTSPPYYNARPEYMEYTSYEEYLLKIRNVIRQTHRVLSEGRFFVINIAPVLIRRASRSEASQRIAVPFDFHRIFVEEGYDFVDDIIWEKPEGAGWATGRGRRFAADRNPLQYKPVPVTEYVLVYRKHTDKLIDWNIRSHPDQVKVEQSRIGGEYDHTNIWRIRPAHDKRHPAVFPIELAERVIRYYSFVGDVVLDPFAGIGTVGKAASRLGRRFVLIDKDPHYVDIIRTELKDWLGREASTVLAMNCPAIDASAIMF
jgi:DNA modification methylase